VSLVYIEGKEEAALDFYQKQLQLEDRPEEKAALQGIVVKLRREVKDRHESATMVTDEVAANQVSV